MPGVKPDHTRPDQRVTQVQVFDIRIPVVFYNLINRAFRIHWMQSCMVFKIIGVHIGQCKTHAACLHITIIVTIAVIGACPDRKIRVTGTIDIYLRRICMQTALVGNNDICYSAVCGIHMANLRMKQHGHAKFLQQLIIDPFEHFCVDRHPVPITLLNSHVRHLAAGFRKHPLGQTFINDLFLIRKRTPRRHQSSSSHTAQTACAFD